jgi:hypothetical protein
MFHAKGTIPHLSTWLTPGLAANRIHAVAETQRTDLLTPRYPTNAGAKCYFELLRKRLLFMLLRLVS